MTDMRAIGLLTRLSDLRGRAARARLARLRRAAQSDAAAAERAEATSRRAEDEAADYAMRRFAEGPGTQEAASFVASVLTGSAHAKRHAALARLQSQRLAREAQAATDAVAAQRAALADLDRRATALDVLTARLSRRAAARAHRREEAELDRPGAEGGTDGTP